MRNTRKSGQILWSKKRPRPTPRSGRGSRTNSNTSRQILVRVIEADSARAATFTFAVCQPWCGRRLTRGASKMTEPATQQNPVLRSRRRPRQDRCLGRRLQSPATHSSLKYLPPRRFFLVDRIRVSQVQNLASELQAWEIV